MQLSRSGSPLSSSSQEDTPDNISVHTRQVRRVRVTGVLNSFVIAAQTFTCGSCLHFSPLRPQSFMGFWDLLSTYMDLWPPVWLGIITNSNGHFLIFFLYTHVFLPTTGSCALVSSGNPPISHLVHWILGILASNSNLSPWLEQLELRWNTMWVQESQHPNTSIYWNLVGETFSFFQLWSFSCQRPPLKK